MNILTTSGWQDYELLDSGDSMRLERFGKYFIAKPDPQAIWKKSLPSDKWQNLDAIFENGKWHMKTNLPQKWLLNYKKVSFYAKLTPFKHTGVFAEQVLNWEFMENKIKQSQKQPKILNLFAYTGLASIICASENAFVTHLDASKSSIAWAKENQLASKLPKDSIRWILDDALDFTAREARRNNMYDAIIMDPPAYGHGPNNEIWDFEKSFPMLLRNIKNILVKNPLFVIVNAYALSSSGIMLNNLLEDYLDVKHVDYGELVLKQINGRLLSTGIFARF